ncbi:MAG: hypothetical protein FK734_19975 [Asgard group archaeon]|nr:hypothetical protein [Asgard group archaeon]
MNHPCLGNDSNRKVLYSIVIIWVLLFQFLIVSTNSIDIKGKTESDNQIIAECEVEDCVKQFVINNLTSWDGNLANPFNFEIYGDYLFAIDFYYGIYVFDISNILSPIYLTIIDDYIFPNSFAYSGGPTLDFVIVDNKLFITDYFYDLYVFDISDIYNPYQLYNGSSLGINAFFDFEVHNGLVFANVFHLGDDYILVLDSSATSAPAVVSIVDLPEDIGFDHFKVTDDYLYAFGHYMTLVIYDITDIENPVTLVQINNTAVYSTQSIAVYGELLVAALYTSIYYELNGLMVYNISDPLNPFEVANCTSENIPGLGQNFLDVVLQDKTCYAMDQELGLQIVDLQNVSAVQLLSTYELNEGERIILHLSTYIAALSTHGELHFVNVINPNTPQKYSSINFGDNTYDVEMQDNFIFVANGYDGWYIFELNGNTVEVISHYKDLSIRFLDLVVKNNLLFAITFEKTLMVFDISNKYSPVKLGSYQTTNSTWYFPKLIVEDNLVFITSSSKSIELVNVSDPNAPSFLSLYDIQNQESDVFQSLIVDMTNELFYCLTKNQLEVVSITNLTNPILITNHTFFDTGGRYKIELNAPYLYINQVDRIVIVNMQDYLNPVVVNTIEEISPYGFNLNDDILYVRDFNLTTLEIKTLIFNYTDVINPFFLTCDTHLSSTRLAFSGDIIAEALSALGFSLYVKEIICMPISTQTVGWSQTNAIYFLAFTMVICLSIIARLKKYNPHILTD